ncbi:MAG: TRAP transporter small permease [Geminicoccaceae bacterium]|nr:TRAP transporter small permease [Geminicoccaceae bacterium]
MRRVLDGLYDLAGALAAVFLVALLVVVSFQVLLRWLAVPFPGATAYAGYCMAASSFLALPYALNAGAHIRVSILLARLTGTGRRVAELWCLLVASSLAWYFAWYAIKAVRISHLINDVSQGQDATPLWIPQLAMAAGTVLLGIAFTDHLLRVALGKETAVPDAGAVE